MRRDHGSLGHDAHCRGDVRCHPSNAQLQTSDSRETTAPMIGGRDPELVPFYSQRCVYLDSRALFFIRAASSSIERESASVSS